MCQDFFTIVTVKTVSLLGKLTAVAAFVTASRTFFLKQYCLAAYVHQILLDNQAQAGNI